MSDRTDPLYLEVKRAMWAPPTGRWVLGAGRPEGFGLIDQPGNQLPGPYQRVPIPGGLGLTLFGGEARSGWLEGLEYGPTTRATTGMMYYHPLGEAKLWYQDETLSLGPVLRWWRAAGAPAGRVRVIGFEDLRLPLAGELLMARLPGGSFELWRGPDGCIRGRLQWSSRHTITSGCYLEGGALGSLLAGWDRLIEDEMGQPSRMPLEAFRRIPSLGYQACQNALQAGLEHRKQLSMNLAAFEVACRWARQVGECPTTF
jgi:hypothetical protein